MDAAELDRSLEELSERIDRLRALYEQYFCGIEKLEPQIPRKDVDRRIHILRKEQIRNTAMRFRFQTLVQRYNTMSQHWSRVLREIENGTHRRDLAKAAARFGVDAALTAVGRKRADKLQLGLKAQLEKDAKRKQDATSSRRKKQSQEQEAQENQEYEELAEADLIVEDDFDDEAPTPPPSQSPLSAPPFGVVYPDSAAPLPPASSAIAAPSHEPEPAAMPHAGRRGVGFFRDVRGQPAQASSGQPLASPAAEPAVKKAGGGLRIGGGPSRRANQSALERIASSLGQTLDVVSPVEAQRPAAGAVEPVAARGAAGARKPLLSAPIEVDVPPAPVVRKPLLSAPLEIDVPAAPATRKPLLSSPLEVDVPVTAAKPEPTSGLKPPPRSGAERAAQLRPAPKAEPPKPAAPDGDISDNRLREIYSDYVNSRRKQQESTAGVTFDKLADSLRSQADRLREKHSAKRVDYEVVVKDGKTLIKPIVK